MTTYYIYGLVDPLTDEVRYVGLTIHPQERYSQHLVYGRKGYDRMPTHEWVSELLERNTKPVMKVLEECCGESKSHARELERQWMHHYIDKGEALLNRQISKKFRRYSRVLPGREPRLRVSREHGWHYSYD